MSTWGILHRGTNGKFILGHFEFACLWGKRGAIILTCRGSKQAFQINWLLHDESRTRARYITLTFCLFYLLPQLGTAERRLFWLEAEGHRWYQQLQAL